MREPNTVTSIFSVFLSIFGILTGCESIWKATFKQKFNPEEHSFTDQNVSATDTILKDSSNSRGSQGGTRKSENSSQERKDAKNAQSIENVSSQMHTLNELECEKLSKLRLGAYLGPVATAGEAGGLFDRSGASLDQIFQNGVKILPRFSRLDGAPLPLSEQPGYELLKCYSSVLHSQGFNGGIRFAAILGASTADSVATEPILFQSETRKRFESCILNAAKQLAGPELDQRQISVSGRFLPANPEVLVAPKVLRSNQSVGLFANVGAKSVRRGDSILVRVIVKNNSPSPLEYIRSNCQRSTLLEVSVPGLLYGGRVSSCVRPWERKVNINPGHEIFDSIRIKVDKMAELGLRRFQIFRRFGRSEPSPIVCSNVVKIQVQS